MKYAIYRTIKFMDKYIDSLVCITFTEDAAHEIVQSFRKQMGNQMCYYKEIK